jgi:hypothetical protein
VGANFFVSGARVAGGGLTIGARGEMHADKLRRITAMSKTSLLWKSVEVNFIAWCFL